MPSDKEPISQKEFDSIYSKVPRLTVEIILRNSDEAIYLTKRATKPCKGQWHLPGGTVRFGEPMLDTVKRVALRELGIKVKQADSKGYIEYPSHYSRNLDSPVGIVFEIVEYTDKLKTNYEAEDSGWFNKLPINMHADQDIFLLQNGYLRK
jgi:ADP-ribose pyrophosphatase YjhB (NUDIX family)